jgi:hypothetical protein
MAEFENNPECELVGQGQAVYYYIPLKRYKYCNNTDRCSFCQTAWRNTLIPKIYGICDVITDPFIDMQLWRDTNTKKRIILDEKALCVGMKGLPGREGLTFGHKKPNMFIEDTDLKVLDSLIGDDTEFYRRFMK